MNQYNVQVTRYQGIQESCHIRVEANDEEEARAKAGQEAASNTDLSWDFVDGWDLAGYDNDYIVTPVTGVWAHINFVWLGVALLEAAKEEYMRNLGIALCEMALVGANSKAEKKLRELIWNLALDEVENKKFSDDEVRGIRRVMRGIR